MTHAGQLEGFLDLDGQLAADERMVRDNTRRFVQERIVPSVGDWFDAGTFPLHLVKELGALGLLGMHLEGYGCAGVNATAYGLACMELEAGDSGCRSFVSVQGSLAMYPIWRYGSDAQRDRWLPGMAAGELIGCFGLTEPDVGSNPRDLRTRARREGSDWVLDGTKMWITNGSIADVAVIWARTEEGIRGFVVPTDTAGLTATDIDRKMSLRASVTSEIALDGVRVPEDAILPGATGLRAPLSCLDEARFGIVWGALGAARACLESALGYAQTRTQFDKPIAAFQLTQQKLVDGFVELQKGLQLALRLGRLSDAGQITSQQISLGKLNNVREALDIARTCRTILAANGVTLDYPIIRHMANLESVLTYEGTNEIHTLILGQHLTGISAFD